MWKLPLVTCYRADMKLWSKTLLIVTWSQERKKCLYSWSSPLDAAIIKVNQIKAVLYYYTYVWLILFRNQTKLEAIRHRRDPGRMSDVVGDPKNTRLHIQRLKTNRWCQLCNSSHYGKWHHMVAKLGTIACSGGHGIKNSSGVVLAFDCGT